MADPDLSEVWAAIGNALAGDSTLTGLLSSASAIYYDEAKMPAQPDFPAIRFLVLNDNPNTQLSGHGDYRPALQIDVLGSNQRTNRRILARLDTLLTIPRVRRSAITSSNFTVRQMDRTGSNTIPTGITDNGREVVQLSTDWSLKVTETS